jgi:hypothetical protein
MLRAYRKNGTEVLPGDEITDFRGDTAIFERAVRAPDAGRTGKIQVRADVGGEYYMGVFGLEVFDVPDTLPIPDVSFWRQMRQGHRNRTGHEMAGHLVPGSERGIWKAVYTCCGG